MNNKSKSKSSNRKINNNVSISKNYSQKTYNCWDSPYVICKGDFSIVSLNSSFSKTYETFHPVKEYAFSEKHAYKPVGLSIDKKRDFDPMREKAESNKTVFNVALYNKLEYIFPLDFSKCAYRNCKYVGTKIEESTDVVVVCGMNLHPKVVPERWPHQLYAMVGWESPINYNSAVTQANSRWAKAFNITITYRRDADVFAPYGMLKFNPTGSQGINLTEFALNKTKTALWVTSNCDQTVTKSRLEYVKELQRYVDVDIFGKCGKPCTFEKRGLCVPTQPYRFYLAFENSFCEDYFTEKLFKSYSKDYPLVPIVRGGSDYDSFLPRMSFIDSGTFVSPKSLAGFMKRLSQRENIDKYVEYLRNRMMYSSTGQSDGDFYPCRLCEHLNKRDPRIQTIYDMPKWLGTCRGDYNFNDGTS